MLRPVRHITSSLAIFLPNLLFARSFDLHAPDGFITINSGQGGFTAPLDPGDRFSRYHDAAGDLNGDGVNVRDALGRAVNVLVSRVSDETLEVDLGHLPSGLYLISDPAGSRPVRVVREKAPPPLAETCIRHQPCPQPLQPVQVLQPDALPASPALVAPRPRGIHDQAR